MASIICMSGSTQAWDGSSMIRCSENMPPYNQTINFSDKSNSVRELLHRYDQGGVNCVGLPHMRQGTVYTMKTESTIESRMQCIEESMQVISQHRQQQRNHTSHIHQDIYRKFNSGGLLLTHPCMYGV